MPDPGGVMPGSWRRRVVRRFSFPGIQAWVLLGPGMFWLISFFLAPLLIMLAYSFMPRGIYGGVERGFTLEHYARFFDPLYLDVLRRTFAWSLACTVICLVLGYPVAYVIVRSSRWRNLLLSLVVLPFWTSFLVRTFAMIFLMRDTGLINNWLLKLHVVSEPLTILYTPFAVMSGLVYGFLPFMIL